VLVKSFSILGVLFVGVVIGWFSHAVFQQSTENPGDAYVQLVDDNAEIESSSDAKPVVDVDTQQPPLSVSELSSLTQSARALLNNSENDNVYESAEDYELSMLMSQGNEDDKLVAIEHFVTQASVKNIAIGLGDANDIIKVAAIHGLAQVGDIGAVQVLGQVLMSENSDDIKIEALTALSQLSYHQHALIFIKHAAEHDPSESVRKFSLNLL
jgi:hypothetical protein